MFCWFKRISAIRAFIYLLPSDRKNSNVRVDFSLSEANQVTTDIKSAINPHT